MDTLGTAVVEIVSVLTATATLVTALAGLVKAAPHCYGASRAFRRRGLGGL